MWAGDGKPNGRVVFNMEARAAYCARWMQTMFTLCNSAICQIVPFWPLNGDNLRNNTEAVAPYQWGR